MKSLLEKEFENYLKNTSVKYVSFDIFDTLVLRKLNQPIDIFEKMALAKPVKKMFGESSNFQQLRITAEKLAREKSLKEEVSIFEIYTQFEYLTQEEQEELIEVELSTEKKYLFINKEIEKWVELALTHNKNVIFISDMYLNKEQITNIVLNKFKNFEKIHDIFVSSDLKITKHKGSMYDYVLEKLKIRPKEMLHIGDNLLSDISSASIRNISTLHYNFDYINSAQIQNEKLYFSYSDNFLSIRSLASIKNPYKEEQSRFFYNFGATIAGPLFWSFSHWLMDICLKNEIDNIGFILREGDIFKKYFAQILEKNNKKKEFNLKNINVSRKSLFLPTLSKKDYDLTTLNLGIFRKCNVREFYTKLDLSIDTNDIKAIQEKELTEIKESVNLLKLIIDNLDKRSDEISKNRKKQKKLFLKYWKSLNLNSNTMLFDFGANSSMHKRIKTLVKKDYINVLFYRTKEGFENSLNQKQYTYINYNEENKYKIELLRRSPDIFEILFNGILGTTLGYVEKDDKVLPIIDKYESIKDSSIIEAFQNGIDNYFKLSISYKQKGNLYSSNDILSLITRVIELPTTFEAKYLGKLLINTTDNASVTMPLISADCINKLKEIGIEKSLRNMKNNLYKDWQKIPWLQGTITLLDSNRLKQIYTKVEDINQVALDELLEKIEQKELNEVSIYGVGEFFLNLLPELLIRNIKVKYLIETKPSKSEFMGYKILSPEEIVETNQKNFIIASVAFSSVMVEKLNSVFKQNNKTCDDIFCIL